jgi:hypothetical protein
MVQRLGHGSIPLTDEAQSGATLGNCAKTGKRRNPFALSPLLAAISRKLAEILDAGKETVKFVGHDQTQQLTNTTWPGKPARKN